MGIGLSLVKEFVELHEGRVEVRSAGVGQGSEFLVRLPLAPAPAAVANAKPKAPSVEPRRVLVVDDNEDAAKAISTTLRIFGHEVRTAFDGTTAVELAVEFQPDLVLLDLGMPKMDGYEAAKRIRADVANSEVFLVAVTGWGAEADRRRTRAAGFDQHLVKPLTLDALTRLIAALPAKSS
jgi:CheY-like chemotaxis protein